MFCKKANLAQIITPQKAKLGPDNNATAICCEVIICIYTYIYSHGADMLRSDLVVCVDQLMDGLASRLTSGPGSISQWKIDKFR